MDLLVDLMGGKGCARCGDAHAPKYHVAVLGHAVRLNGVVAWLVI
jgi:hypothetical protein